MMARATFFGVSGIGSGIGFGGRPGYDFAVVFRADFLVIVHPLCLFGARLAAQHLVGKERAAPIC